jgi:hypothetical protein
VAEPDQENLKGTDRVKEAEQKPKLSVKASAENFTAEQQVQPTEKFTTYSGEEPKKVLLAAIQGESLEKFTARTKQYHEEQDKKAEEKKPVQPLCISGFEDGSEVVAGGRQKTVEKTGKNESIDLSPSHLNLKAIAQEDSALEAVVALRDHAATLPPGPERDRQEALARQMEAEMLSPSVRAARVGPTEQYNAGTHVALKPDEVSNAEWQQKEPEALDLGDQQKLAIRDDYLDRTEYKEESDAERHIRIMKEHYAAGETVASFIQRPGTKDAIRASASFALAVQDLNECKWGSAIRIWRGHPTEITDYSAEFNLMELDSKDGARRQAEVFSHEAYHATHQDLDKLFGTGESVSKKDYVDIKMHQEAGAFLQEIKTNEDLHRSRPNPLHSGDDPNKHIEFMWVDKANPKAAPHKQDMNALLVREHGKINEAASLKRIESFLREHPAAIKDGAGEFEKDSSGNYRMNDYAQHYESGHEEYRKKFSKNREYLLKMGYIRD